MTDLFTSIPLGKRVRYVHGMDLNTTSSINTNYGRAIRQRLNVLSKHTHACGQQICPEFDEHTSVNLANFTATLYKHNIHNNTHKFYC